MHSISIPTGETDLRPMYTNIISACPALHFVADDIITLMSTMNMHLRALFRLDPYMPSSPTEGSKPAQNTYVIQSLTRVYFMKMV